MASQFGQLMSLINLANQTQYLAAEAAIQAYKIRKEAGVAESEAKVKAQIEAMNLPLKEKQMLLDKLASERRDTTIRDIAVWTIVGLGSLITILFVGLNYAKKKQAEKYEYVIETARKRKRKK